jgi:hypothetical protein
MPFGYYRVRHFTNHASLEVWLFSFRLNFKIEWSGHKTTHWWRIRKWGWREWVETCVNHYRNSLEGASLEKLPADPFEGIVARVALALGWEGGDMTAATTEPRELLERREPWD